MGVDSNQLKWDDFFHFFSDDDDQINYRQPYCKVKMLVQNWYHFLEGSVIDAVTSLRQLLFLLSYPETHPHTEFIIFLHRLWIFKFRKLEFILRCIQVVMIRSFLQNIIYLFCIPHLTNELVMDCHIIKEKHFYKKKNSCEPPLFTRLFTIVLKNRIHKLCNNFLQNSARYWITTVKIYHN